MVSPEEMQSLLELEMISNLVDVRTAGEYKDRLYRACSKYRFYDHLLLKKKLVKLDKTKPVSSLL